MLRLMHQKIDKKTRKISVVNRFECWLRKRILTKLSIHASLFALSKIPGFWGTDRTSLIKKKSADQSIDCLI